MKTFIVNTRWVGTSHYYIKAKNKKEAEKKYEVGGCDLFDDELYYDEEVTSIYENKKIKPLK